MNDTGSNKPKSPVARFLKSANANATELGLATVILKYDVAASLFVKIFHVLELGGGNFRIENFGV